MLVRQTGFFGLSLPLSVLILLACGPWAGASQAQSPNSLGAKNILILHAFESNVPIFELTDRGLRAVLDAGGVSIRNQFYEYLDLARNPGAEYREKIGEVMRLRYGRRKIDMIVTMYPEALHFLLNDGRATFPDVPVLGLYMPAGVDLPKTDRLIIQHLAKRDVVGTLEMALKLVPDAKRVFVVSGAHELDRRIEESARRDFKKWEGRLEFRYLNNMLLEEILATVSSAPADSIVFFLGMAADVSGKNYTTREVAKRLGEVSGVPVFGLYDVALGYGIAGGSLISFEHIGTKAGQLALDILSGIKTRDSAPERLDVPPVPMFDWRQLRRWNLSVDALPPGSILINREYTLWEQYRTGVVAIFFAFAVLVLLIVSLLVSRAQRQRVERKLAEQLGIETLLAELSARFVNLPADQVESEIQDAQRRICETLDLDRSTLWQVPEEGPATLRLTHVHTPAGTAPIPERMDALDFAPWSLSRLLRGDALIIPTLAALPPEAARDRETFRRYGTKSTVLIPLSAEGGTVLGALSFAVTRGEREWPEDVVNDFRMVAQVIANALARKKADQALRNSQARLTLAAASADARLWELDADTGRIWMTDEGRAFFGLGGNEALNLDRAAGFIHPDDRESWRKSIRQSLESGRPMRAEFRVVLPDGSIRWIVAQARPNVDAGGRYSRMLGVSIDITDRRQMEERLRTSEALSSGVLSSLPGHMIILDRSGALLRASDAWREFAAGHGASDPTVLAVGAGDADARPRAARKLDSLAQTVRDGVAAVLAGTQADFRLEYPYPTPTETRWASITVQPLQRPEGGAVIYHQDITRQRQDRLETERLRRDLAHVGRVTTMGEMAAALAHELNQPLTAILSNAHAGERYLGQANPPLGEIREILQDVVGDARRAGEVIQRLRSLLRKDDTKFVALDINQVIREMAALTHTEAVLRNLTIQLDLASDLPPVRGDRVQLLQVLLNLVVNGMEAMGSQAEGRRIDIETARDGEVVRLGVRDEGPGIPPEALKDIFETFYTTKPRGMGMGLAICRAIVEAHGGRLWAENNPDRGATFWFTLPVCPPDPSPA